MFARVLEPIPDDSAADAAAYQAMDHRQVNTTFVNDLLSGGGVGPRVIDLGCGPAGIALMLGERWRELEDAGGLSQSSFAEGQLQIMAVDFSVDMLELASFEIELNGMQDLVWLQQIDLTDPESLQEDLAQTIISNTVFHHLPDPITGIQVAMRALMPGGRIFIRDLFRPGSEDEVERLVEEHTDTDVEVDVAPEYAPSQLLRQSLLASLTLEEAREMVSAVGIPGEAVQMTSDRHWTLDWTSPGNGSDSIG
ncbi:MAG TPA: methyltransferase domain-containing protein [Rhodopirellula baltica]|uniref:UbiE/COQ5 methyltransferase n=2 Tax=Rhodopirellula baltica TaxID=265606 RepID=K5DN33_RHOBT|nr:methyltransferase domain-containing protein [Rhodopirellula baltica]EKK04259.1 UbiE/COQ5 methyltransferase [Rhodopirellula baltica SH28]HBE62341.1 methyltransferase domain-containing protein [Rhodopirellula baltica]